MRTPRNEFSVETMRQAWARCKAPDGEHRCEHCTSILTAGRIDYDHVVPNALGGEPTLANCAVLCRTCHRLKTSNQDIPSISKAKVQNEKHFGMRKKGRGFGYGNLRKRMDGTVVERGQA